MPQREPPSWMPERFEIASAKLKQESTYPEALVVQRSSWPSDADIDRQHFCVKVGPNRGSEMNDASEEIARDIALVGQLECVPTILRVLCEVTGMGFAAVARVTDGTWTACAVLDQIGFGLMPGGQLDVNTTLCKEVRSSRTPIVIEHASSDPVYRNHPTPRIYSIESYVSVPIVLPEGEYFGNLCAIDPHPAKVCAPGIVAMFVQFAELIARQLQNERRGQVVQAALLDARSARDWREQLVRILGHDLRAPIGSIALSSQRLKASAGDRAAVLSIASDIAANAQRASDLIGGALEFARGRLGADIIVEPGLVDRMDEALFSVLTEIQSTHGGRDIEWQFDITRPVRVDRVRVQQLAANLLSNALEHSAPAGKTRITATTTSSEFGLSVWNEGPSIPPGKLGDAFAPYWRTEGVGRHEGPGLGLHISAQIAKAHGGRLSVASSGNTGTTFMAVFPA